MIVLLVAAPSAAAASCPNADTVPTPRNLSDLAASTLCLLNAERESRGLARLREDERLDRVSRRYGQRMTKESFFAHVAPDGQTPMQRIRGSGYLAKARGWLVGENLLWATDQLSTPRQAVRAWMHSPEHRRNILDPEFRQIGVGLAFGAPASLGSGATAATYVTEFGVRSFR